jgi:hypothetical protein
MHKWVASRKAKDYSSKNFGSPGETAAEDGAGHAGLEMTTDACKALRAGP